MKSFPRIQRRPVPGGETVETDSGMFVATKTAVAGRADTFADLVEAVQSIAPTDPKVAVARIREEAWRVAGMGDQPAGMREDAARIALLCEDLERHVIAGDLAVSVELSLQIGQLWGFLRCRTLEPEIIKRRNSVEGSRKPRQHRGNRVWDWLSANCDGWRRKSPAWVERVVRERFVKSPGDQDFCQKVGMTVASFRRKLREQRADAKA